jgi:hypothetical protein
MSPALQNMPCEEDGRFIRTQNEVRQYGHVTVRLVADLTANDVTTRYTLSADRLSESDLARVRSGIADWLAAHSSQLVTHQFYIEVINGSWLGGAVSAHYEAAQFALSGAAKRVGLLKNDDVRA